MVRAQDEVEDRNILLGFAGPGKVSKNNVKDLLKDYLDLGPEDNQGLPGFPEGVEEIRAVVPVGEDYLTPTVSLLIEWTDEYAEFPYEAIYDVESRKNRGILTKSASAIEARNIAAAMIDRLVEGRKNGDEVTLIVAWGEDGDEVTEMMVDLAHAKELKVLDITAGLDDLKFGDGEEAAPEPEPEPARPARRGRRTAEEPKAEEAAEDEEKPRRRRGAPRKTAETAPEASETAQPESVEAEVAHARQKAETGTEAAPLDTSDDIVLQALIASFHLVKGLDTCHASMTLKGKPVESALTVMLREAIELQSKPDDASPKGGRPRADGTPARKRTPAQRGVKEWQDEGGTWHRQGRGRPPKDVPIRTVNKDTGDVIED